MISQSLLDNIFRQQILALSAYSVAKADNLIKLDAMENPYHWPESLKTAWLERLLDAELNRYPDPKATQLTQALRALYSIPEQADILLGNGSDEIIQLLLMALPNGSCVLTPKPGFVMYQQVSLSLGLNFHSIPLLPNNFELDLPAMLTAIIELQPALIFLAFPNNPTGNLFDNVAIEAILDAAPGLVVVDEAYAPFANASFMDSLPNHPQLLVMRTVSKLGLAGLRLGYMAGHPALIEQLDKIRLPYNINILTQISATFALENHAVFTEQTQIICQERSRVFEELKALPGLMVYPSAANFILFRTPPNCADLMFNSLKQQGILIKNLHPQGGLLTDCLRVTIGAPAENDAFMQGIKIALEHAT